MNAFRSSFGIPYSFGLVSILPFFTLQAFVLVVARSPKHGDHPLPRRCGSETDSVPDLTGGNSVQASQSHIALDSSDIIEVSTHLCRRLILRSIAVLA